MTRTDLNQLNPAAGGLPSEAQMLAWAAELSGEIPAAGVPVPSVPTASVPAASVPAATAGTDWARIATEVLESEGPVVCEVFTPIGLTARPKQVSYKNSKGQMESLPLEYMNPPLPEDEFNENMIIPLFEKN